MEENKPNYYSVLPAEVRYSDMTPNAKLLYSEITALCNKEGYCWASNKYFSNLFKVNPTSISRLLGELREGKFIEIEVKDNYQRKIFLTPLLKIITPLMKNHKPPYEKSEDNTKYNTKNNIVESKDSTTSKARQDSFKEIDKLTGVKRKGGNPEIDYLISLMKEKFNLSILDGTQSENRKYCWLALQKFKSDGVKLIIEAGSVDAFWKNKVTGFKSLYYHGVKIASTLRKSGRVGIINV